MRRSICYCEPATSEAGEASTWKFVYTPSIDLPKGTKLKFDLLSKGREIDWQVPSANLKKTSNVLYGLINNKKVVAAKELFSKDTMVARYVVLLQRVLPS